MGVKIKKPKGGHYFHYCYECRWFEYQGQIGAYDREFVHRMLEEFEQTEREGE